jgi:hypothetical protein
MPAHPAPVAENIDEHAVRRSIRVSLIIMVVFVLSGALTGFLVQGQVGQRPSGVRHSTSAWLVVFLVAVVGIMLLSIVLLMRREFRKPNYRRVAQYGWRRRRGVVKDLCHDRPLSAADLPVAAAMVDSMRSQRRRQVILFWVMPVIFVFNGLMQHGALRWFQFGVAVFWVGVMPFYFRQYRRVTRGYERQNTPNTGGHQDDAASETTG